MVNIYRMDVDVDMDEDKMEKALNGWLESNKVQWGINKWHLEPEKEMKDRPNE